MKSCTLFFPTLLLFAFPVSVAQMNSANVESFLAELNAAPLTERHTVVERFFGLHPQMPVIEDDTVVWFFYYGSAQKVAIVGDIQRAWMDREPLTKIDCGERGLFYRTYHIPRDARIDYKLVVDEKDITDPLNPLLTPSGFGDHSEVRMPGFSSTPLLRRDPVVPAGSLDTLTFKSQDRAIRTRNIIVYTPPGYDPDTKWYPSVYVHDGREALNFAFYPTVVDNLIAKKQIQPMIMVFIPPVRRTEEYLTDDHVLFGDVVCDEIVPLIDGRYRTSLKPEDRLMMGISNGGHISLRSVLRRPDVFLNAAGQSSTPSKALFDGIREALDQSKPGPAFRLFIDVGVYDLGADTERSFLNGNREIHQLLTDLGQQHEYLEFNDGHQWANWRERTPDILQYFFPYQR